MASTQHTDPGATPPDVDVLVTGIQELLSAARTLRQMGGKVQLPPRLVQVCQEVLDEVAASPATQGSHPRSRDDSRESDMDDALRDIPLRRLLWQVIKPGETFTVPDVVMRLATLGKHVDPTKVSNALGYQVDRGKLVRERKGLYTYPVKPSSAGTTVPSDQSTADTVESTPTDRRHPGDDHGRRTEAVRGQEGNRDSSTVQERRQAM